MDNPAQINSVRFRNGEFSAQGGTLLDQQSKILSVPKKDIRHITLKYGFQSERPIVEVVFGVAVILIGLYFFINFLLEIMIHRIVYIEESLSLLMLPVGGWFIIDGFRKRLYFEVALDNDKRKFPLGKSPDRDELQKFIKTTSQLGYMIDADILNKNIA